MATLSENERAKAIELLDKLRADLKQISSDDDDLLFSMRRYILKRLEFDERGTPTQRRKLKDLKRKFQHGLCYECAEPLPAKGAELHRLSAIEGYTEANTRLLCRACHQKAQQADAAE
jgi:hypothetical protein